VEIASTHGPDVDVWSIYLSIYLSVDSVQRSVGNFLLFEFHHLVTCCNNSMTSPGRKRFHWYSVNVHTMSYFDRMALLERTITWFRCAH
jgi:hypothetical protein